MAIFHLSAKIVTRSRGQSAVAKAAYNAHDLLTNEKTGNATTTGARARFCFRASLPRRMRRSGRRIVKPYGQPWSGKRPAKTRSLPEKLKSPCRNESTQEQREYLIKDFVRENFVRKGMVADVALHLPHPDGDPRNYHAHVLLTMREIGPEGSARNYKNANPMKQGKNGANEAMSSLRTGGRSGSTLPTVTLNASGTRPGLTGARLKRRGIDREPTVHIGPTATQFEREGVQTERGGINRQIEDRNQQREELRAQHAESVKDYQEHQEAAKQEREADRLEAAQRRPEAIAEKGTAKRQARQIDKDIDKGLTKTAPRLLKGAAKAVEGVLNVW